MNPKAQSYCPAENEEYDQSFTDGFFLTSDMEITRSYTSVLPSLIQDNQDPRIDQGTAVYLLIKIYPNGALTPWIDTLQPGLDTYVFNHQNSFILCYCLFVCLAYLKRDITTRLKSTVWRFPLQISEILMYYENLSDINVT